MSSTDLRVRLTGQDGDGGVSGTRFSSDTQGMASAMRMSFTADGHTWVYNPNGGGAHPARPLSLDSTRALPPRPAICST